MHEVKQFQHGVNFQVASGHISFLLQCLAWGRTTKQTSQLRPVICHGRMNRWQVFLAYQLSLCLKPETPCDALCNYASVFIFVYSTWSLSNRWWTMRGMNGWRAWLKTLRRSWDPGCSGTSNSNPGGPPTMWVRKSLSSPGLDSKAARLIWPPSFFSSPSLCGTGQWLVGRVHLPQRPWAHHGQQQLLRHGETPQSFSIQPDSTGSLKAEQLGFPRVGCRLGCYLFVETWHLNKLQKLSPLRLLWVWLFCQHCVLKHFGKWQCTFHRIDLMCL